MAKKNERKIEVVVTELLPRWLQRKQVIAYASISDHYLDDLIARKAITPHPATNKSGRRVVWYDRLEIDSFISNLHYDA